LRLSGPATIANFTFLSYGQLAGACTLSGVDMDESVRAPSFGAMEPKFSAAGKTVSRFPSSWKNPIRYKFSCDRDAAHNKNRIFMKECCEVSNFTHA
jgi:hypothetical protein